MSVNAWIVVGDQPAISNLITVARSLGPDGTVAAVVAGPRAVAETVAASGVDRVVWAAAGHPHIVFRSTYAELMRMTGGRPVEIA